MMKQRPYKIGVWRIHIVVQRHRGRTRRVYKLCNCSCRRSQPKHSYCNMSSLTLASTIRLTSGPDRSSCPDDAKLTLIVQKGHTMPLLGFGVYKNFTTKESCLEAFKAGYRYVCNRRFNVFPDLVLRHVDSAQAYRNEAAVGAAVRESGLLRAEFFISKHASSCIVTSVTVCIVCFANSNEMCY